MMRKGLLALALAVAFPAAHAQMAANNTVELYGIVDIGGEFIDNGTWTNVLGQRGDVTANKITSGISTGSRWGIRGREDLGGGYSAIFTLESRIEVDTGQVQNNGASFFCSTAAVPGVATPVTSCPGVTLTSPLPPTLAPTVLGANNAVNATLLNAVSTVNSPNALFDRQAYAGLITPFGAILAGRQYTPGYEAFVKFNSFYDSFAGNPGQISTINLRANNALQYRAELKGFTLSAMYGFGGAEGIAGGRNERVNVSNGDDFWGFNLQYVTDWFGVMGAYQQNRTVTYSKPTENQKGLETYGAGAWVGFGAFKFYGQYMRSQNDNPVLSPADIQNIVISTGGNPVAIQNAVLSQYINRWDVNSLRGVAGPTDLDLYHLGMEWAFNSGRLLFAYNHAEDSSRSPWATADAKVDSFGIAYYYYLSKRTWLYGAYALANNGDQARSALGAACCVGGWTGNYGENSQNIQIGMRHTF
jgi:predicted porin